MLLAKLRSLSSVVRGRTKLALTIILFAATLAVPFVSHGIASAEAPFDAWPGKQGKWINRAVIEFNNQYFDDVDPADNIYEFHFAPASNRGCVSKLAYNHENAWGVDQPSPYANVNGEAGEAGLQLKVPVPNETRCDEQTNVPDPNPDNKHGKCSNGASWSYFEQGTFGLGFIQWIGCRTTIDNVPARLISFFKDSDGNIKSISAKQAISFIPAANTYNGELVYVRSDQLNAPCKTVVTKIGTQWTLFSYRPGGSTVWDKYYDVIKQSSGAGTLNREACTRNDDAFLHTYQAGLSENISINYFEGGFKIYVGDVSNQGRSKAAVATPTIPDPAAGTSIVDVTPNCESSGYSLSWVLCPLFNGTADFVQWLLENVIQPLLATENFLDPEGPVYQAWSQFRIYANIFLLIALLVAVFGQAIGTSTTQAISARSVLTSAFVSILLINSSIYIAAGVVGLCDVIGAGIGAAMTAPLHGAGLFQFSPTATQANGVGVTLLTVGIIGSMSGIFSSALIGPQAGLFLVMFALLPALIGVLSLLLVLIARRAIITGGAMISAIPAALYALPNTRSITKTAFKTYTTAAALSIVLPILFALCNILPYLLIKSSDIPSPSYSLHDADFFDSEHTGGIIVFFLAWLLTFMPLVFSGAAVKAAGGLGARVFEFSSGLGKRGHQALLGNENDPNSLRNSVRRRFGAAITQRQSDILARGDDKNAGFMARRRAQLTGSGLFGDVTQRQSNFNALSAKQRAAKSDTGNDAEIFAGAGYMIRADELNHKGERVGANTYYNSKGKEITQTLYDRGKRIHGQNSHEVGEALTYTLGKAQNEEDKAAFRMAFGKNAIAQGWSESEMKGAYAHAAYPHKRPHAAVWYSTPEYEKDASGNIMRDQAGNPTLKFNDVADRQEEQASIYDSTGTERKLYLDAAGGYTTTKTDNKAMTDVGRATSYHGMIEDMHKSRTTFDLSGDKHEDFQVLKQQQENLADRINAREIQLNAARSINANSLETASLEHEQQLDFDLLGKTYETFDAVTQRLVQGDNGEISAGGASAASQAVIRSAMRPESRRFTFDAPHGPDAAGSRTIVVSDPITGKPTPTVVGVANTAGGDPNRGQAGLAPRELVRNQDRVRA